MKQKQVDTQTLRCPRCDQRMYPPRVALSRVDNKTSICPDCGLDEAIKNWQENAK
jgi:RNA polymerase subunit RPABC4/transcription elongation factor Spt4